MKKFFGFLIIFLFCNNISFALTYKAKALGLNPDKLLICNHDETFETSAWEFTDIKDEILGDFILVKPLGVVFDKNKQRVKNLSTRGTLTVLNKNLLPDATKWVQLFYDNETLAIKSIAMFGYLNETVSDNGFKLITIVYEFKSSDKDFLDKTQQTIKKAREAFPKDIRGADDIDAREFFMNILGITKIALQKEYEMDYDMTYKRNRSEYLCRLSVHK
tara:strand:+ start:160 stop:813 length:654 start_codon:yes stop_codon:yes gene_type:complete